MAVLTSRTGRSPFIPARTAQATRLLANPPVHCLRAVSRRPLRTPGPLAASWPSSGSTRLGLVAASCLVGRRCSLVVDDRRNGKRSPSSNQSEPDPRSKAASLRLQFDRLRRAVSADRAVLPADAAAIDGGARRSPRPLLALAPGDGKFASEFRCPACCAPKSSANGTPQIWKAASSPQRYMAGDRVSDNRIVIDEGHLICAGTPHQELLLPFEVLSGQSRVSLLGSSASRTLPHGAFRSCAAGSRCAGPERA